MNIIKLFVTFAIVMLTYVLFSFIVKVPIDNKNNIRYYNECYVKCIILEDYIDTRLDAQGVNTSVIECYKYWKEERDSIYFLIRK